MKRFTDFEGQNLTEGAGFTSAAFFDTQEEQYRVMEALATALIERIGSRTSAVISGCEITGAGPYNIAEGIVYLNTASGIEIRRIPAQVGVSAGAKFIIPDTDLDETVLYGNGIAKNFFVTKRATLGATEAGAIEFDPSNDDLPFIGDLSPLTWNAVTLINGYTGTLQYAIDIEGNVHWRSDGLSAAGAGGSSVFANIPAAAQMPTGFNGTFAHVGSVSSTLRVARVFNSANQWIIQDLSGVGAIDGTIPDFYYIYRQESI